MTIGSRISRMRPWSGMRLGFSTCSTVPSLSSTSQTTLQERTTARTLQAELLLPDDEVDANHVYRLAAPTQAGALNAIAA